MNAENVLKEMELAAYELAAAETAERHARKLRRSAATRIAAFHAEFKAALSTARKPKLQTLPHRPALSSSISPEN